MLTCRNLNCNNKVISGHQNPCVTEWTWEFKSANAADGIQAVRPIEARGKNDEFSMVPWDKLSRRIHPRLLYPTWLLAHPLLSLKAKCKEMDTNQSFNWSINHLIISIYKYLQHTIIQSSNKQQACYTHYHDTPTLKIPTKNAWDERKFYVYKSWSQLFLHLWLQEFHGFWLLLVQASPLTSWVIREIWRTIQQIPPSSFFSCGRISTAVLAWARMSTLWPTGSWWK